MSKIFSALVIDDHDDECMLLRVALPKCGVTPTICPNTAEATKDIANHDSYDFIFVDMHMSNKSAFVFLQLLGQHRNQALRAVPIIGFVGRINQSELSGLAEAGVFNLISKPLNEKTLLEKTNKIIAEYQDPKSATSIDLAFRRAILAADSAAALAIAKSNMENNPKSMRSHVSLAVAYYYAKQNQDAKSVLTKLLPSMQDSLYLPHVLTLLAKVYIREKQPQQALQLLEKAQAIFPHNMERLFLIGELLLATNKPAVAEQKFRTAIRFFPQSKSARVGLGKALVAQGNADGALEITKSAPGATQNLISHLNRLGVGLSKAGKYEDAVATYETALKLVRTPRELSSLWYNISLAWTKGGQYQKASAACTKSIQAEPTNEKAQALLLRCGTEMAKPVQPGAAPTLNAAVAAANVTTNGGIIPDIHLTLMSDDLVERIEKGVLEDAMG